jgi:hypothetical protein
MAKRQRTNKDLQKSSTLVFLIPNFHILFTFDFKCTQWRLLQKHLYDVGFFFFVIVHFFLYRKNCWPSQFTCSFHYYHFGLSLILFSLIFAWYIVGILYFVGIWATIRLHQSNNIKNSWSRDKWLKLYL